MDVVSGVKTDERARQRPDAKQSVSERSDFAGVSGVNLFGEGGGQIVLDGVEDGDCGDEEHPVGQQPWTLWKRES